MTNSIDRPESQPPIEVMLVELDKMLPTEEVEPVFVDTLVAGMRVSGVWTHPLLLEERTLAILDGHHRFEAAKRIGLRWVPAVRVSYSDPRIHLESWRPGLRFEPADILDCARKGHLLPYKSTRHMTEFVLPQVRVLISTLQSAEAQQRPVASAGQHPTRSMMLAPAYNRLCSRLRIRPDATSNLEIETPETQVPHTQLRRSLQSDPAMAALLPAAPGRLVLGSSDESPFFLERTGLLHLPPSLLASPAALSIATRWGLEASYLQSSGLLTADLLPGIVLHGKSLLRTSSIDTSYAVLEGIPSRIAEELMERDSGPPSEAVVKWQRSRIEGLCDDSGTWTATSGKATELLGCVEELLISGGDSRIALDHRTGFNRYGTTPRPRPEAVHFSSSTASSISDYGFMYCEMLRRDLLSAMLRQGLSSQHLRAQVVDAMASELLDLMGLSDQEADIALVPSGTDTEMLTVLVSIAAGRPLTNILIAPEETGRGVREAGAGKYFDALSATGQRVQIGQAAWPQAAIRIVEIPIRDRNAVPRPQSAVAADIRHEIEDALARENRVLLHVLASSKTGLHFPTEEAVIELSQVAPESIDVVVDACQMRTPFLKMGQWIRRGWMVQVTGSKFLTGPPFSGALIIPRKFCTRVTNVEALLDQAPTVGSKQDWSGHWRDQFSIATEDSAPSLGALFRWLPALFEAQLFNAIPDTVRQYCFERFRAALNARLDKSQWLLRIQEMDGEVGQIHGSPNLATSSIMCFSVIVNCWDGSRRALDEIDCRKIFQLLNLDVSGDLGQLSPAQRACARLQAHIGQPVLLKSKGDLGDTAILRMVLGARFFGIVAHAGPGSIEAALESEISDAMRALDKLELVAQMWSRAKHIAT
jgi:hypothetical protein